MAEAKKKSTKNETISTTTAEPVSPNTVNPNPDTGINLQDLVTVAQIIQLGTQRGAWRAEELSTIGNLYTKLIAFLKSVGAISDQPQQTNAEETK